MTFAAKCQSRGLTLPDYGGRELGAVVPGALAALGRGDVVTGRDAAADAARLGIPQARHIVVVLLDGLGHHLLDARRGHAPFLRSIEQGFISTGYPSTTASALALLGTGQPSGKTGMTGYTARNPRTGKLANLVSWEGAYDPAEWQREPGLLHQAADAGMTVTSLGKRRFAGSGLTQAAFNGGTFIGAETLPERISVAAQVAREPGLSYCYWGEIDAAGHKHGWNSDAWVAALEDADRELRVLARSLPRGAAMVVTADHGMVDASFADRWDVASDPVLREDVDLVAGEPRALHLHVREGASAAAVANRWQEHLGSHAVVATQEEAAQARLFGDMAESVRDRIGDVVVVMAGESTVVDSRTQSDQSMRLVGVHGSLTPLERDVPLLIASAD
ncbi:alkaline phosphatase family protein [Demequina sp. B12]|uniref:alkaline phosphatase family protein n=1 Tax=Demequina sp. B12 TaxID=2992757 RepID=UPI00237AF2B2|nr:nucleotide pyrophosphatase/phosphodiesterase family protein [Demequina sp. B12]MDE0572986.1 alkaline phosphatase family protein [Demequina sp. B12]